MLIFLLSFFLIVFSSHKLLGHMVFCPMRILPCEPGMHACNRPLHAWFHIEEREALDDDLTNSLFDYDGNDGETRSTFFWKTLFIFSAVFLTLSECFILGRSKQY